MWILYAFLSAVSAALVAILAKLGLKDVDSTLATTIRSIIMAVFLVTVAFALRKFDGFTSSSLSNREWILITFSGIAGAVSWLFYFLALKSGNAAQVAAIDKLSLVFVVVLAAVFLGEALTWRSATGALFMATGAILISMNSATWQAVLVFIKKYGI